VSVAPLAAFLGGQVGDLGQVPLDGLAERGGGSGRIRVRPSRRLGHDLVDHVEARQVRRGQLERVGGVLLPGRVPPENRRAPLRRDHGVDRVLEHERAVPDPQSERSAGAPLPGDRDDDRNVEAGHLPEVHGDGLGLSALLRVDPRVGARGVDER